MSERYMRPSAAGEYSKRKYGFGSKKLLDKLATVGGGPEFHKAGHARLYTEEAIDEWALARIGPPQRTTAENPRPTPPSRDPTRPRGRPRKHSAITEIGESA